MAPLLSSRRILALNAALRKGRDHPDLTLFHFQRKIEKRNSEGPRFFHRAEESPRIGFERIFLTLSSLRHPAAAEKSFLLK